MRAAAPPAVAHMRSIARRLPVQSDHRRTNRASHRPTVQRAGVQGRFRAVKNNFTRNASSVCYDTPVFAQTATEDSAIPPRALTKLTCRCTRRSSLALEGPRRRIVRIENRGT